MASPASVTATHRPWARQQRRRVFWPVAAMVVLSMLGVASVQLAAGDLASSSIATATALAMLPVALVVGVFLWLDRWEPEPGTTLMLAFAWGAGVSVFGALLINSVVGVEYGPAASAVVSAPLAEEGLKGVFLVGLLWWHRHQLDGLVDSVVYAGMVAAGFAFVENIVYLGHAFDTDASDGYLVFVMRGLLSPFSHPLFTVFTGIAVGLAVHRGVAAKALFPLLGYAVAVALHAAWNASALWDGGRIFMSTYLFVMFPIFTGMAILAIWQRRRERRIVATHVPSFADAGWVAPNEVAMMSTMRGRRYWRRIARAQTGRTAAKAVHEYQTAVTELAFVAERMRHADSASHELMNRYDETLESVIASRQSAVAAASAS